MSVQDDTNVAAAESASYLGMSDDEILNLDPSLFGDEPADEEEDDADDGAQEPAPAPGGESDPAGAADDDADTDDDDDESGDAGADDDAGDEPADVGDGGDADPVVADEAAADKPAVDKADKADKADADKSEPVDYKAEYERLMAPFKANGKELKVNNIDEAITLMQMGANYNKKMAALKPNLKLLKLLENHKLLDENKLSFLVDLDKKNPEAIKKLIQDSGLNPLDLDPDEESKYKPNTYTVHDREIELDQVLDELQDTPTYASMIEVVSTKWDKASKQTVADNPQLLRVINDHMARGVYDVISKEIERERMLGHLSGMSDLEAYKHVGDAIQARGGFNHLAQQSPGQAKSPVQAPAQTAATTAAQQAKEDARRNKKRAASAAQATSPVKREQEFNPLAMSDADFEKLVQSQLM